jgi:membrane protein
MASHPSHRTHGQPNGRTRATRRIRLADIVALPRSAVANLRHHRAVRLAVLVRKGLFDALDHHPFQSAAAISYYTLLALAPLLLVVLAMAGLVFGREAVEGQLVDEIRGLTGEQGARVVEIVIQNASSTPQRGPSLVAGIVVLLIGASGVFLQLQTALNTIWQVEAAPRANSLWRFVRHRLVSMAMVFVVGFLLLVSLVISAALSAINAHYATRLPWPLAWEALNACASLLVITVLNAMIFKFLPDVRLRWRDVWLGALVTAVLFTAGKSVIGLYVGRASVTSSYGAAGSVVALVLWVYYAALIFFVGAEITQVYGHWRERRIAPEPHAVEKPPA